AEAHHDLGLFRRDVIVAFGLLAVGALILFLHEHAAGKTGAVPHDGDAVAAETIVREFDRSGSALQPALEVGHVPGFAPWHAVRFGFLRSDHAQLKLTL